MRVLLLLCCCFCSFVVSAQDIFWCESNDGKNISLQYEKLTDLFTYSISYPVAREVVKPEIEIQLPSKLVLEKHYQFKNSEEQYINAYLLGIPNEDVIYVLSELIFSNSAKFGVSVRQRANPNHEIYFIHCRQPVVSILPEIISRSDYLPL